MGSSREVIDIEIDSLQSNPLQPRGLITPESLVDLVDSIREHGILEPLVIAKTPAGYQIIAGERRWRAAKIVGLKTVPAIIKETTPQGMLEMAIVENVQREDLNPLERAQAFVRLIDEFHLTNREIATRIGKSGSYVSNSLKLLQLPDALKDGLLSNLITEGHARALSAIQDPKLMVEAYKIILREGGSVRRAEDVARRIKKKTGAKKGGTTIDDYNMQKAHIISDEIDRMTSDIHKALGGNSAVKVRLTRSQRQTRISIILDGNVKDTDPALQRLYQAVISLH